VAYNRRNDYNIVMHLVIPALGIVANLTCMAFYLISPVFGLGTLRKPLLALAISAVWGIYGGIYFLRSSNAKGNCSTPTKRLAARCPE
jgi:APA family basic amino acid/polyamine antiporter